ncbi:anaerobic ribonucleoside-triphosphate reductase [Turicimonas muris]|uniref:anaerobic ribonucleoside-triphosphate reductase n=3 Tax=Turicimonas muris TaxID=1796652 RepID=UPI00248CDC0B|nr:anaerobic ribonucleoside-triphosphate reductase [Turicimonas muris]
MENKENMMLEKEGIKINDSERTRCEVWTRVMGYHRPIDSFNIGKKGEVSERKYFTEENACKCH